MRPQEDIQQYDPKDVISRRERWLMAAWAAWLVLIYAVGGVFGVNQLQGYKAQTEAERQEQLRTLTTDTGAAVPVAGPATEAAPADVLVGIRVRRIGGFALKEAEWMADFDIWFLWSGETVHPGETFEVVNGDVQRREKIESYVRDGRKYERYHVTAQMTKQYDPSRFPFADEGLTIQIQDNHHEAATLRYVTDERGSGLDSNALPQSVRLKRTLVAATAYRPDAGAGSGGSLASVQSRLVFAMLLKPVSTSVYLMMFQALFAAVAVSMIVFFVRATYDNTRFAIPLAAFFVAVANNIFVSTLLPRADRITLTGMVNMVSLATIFLILVQSAISLYMAGPRGRERLSCVFDRVSFVVMLPCYLVLNVMLPLTAMSS